MQEERGRSITAGGVACSTTGVQCCVFCVIELVLGRGATSGSALVLQNPLALSPSTGTAWRMAPGARSTSSTTGKKPGTAEQHDGQHPVLRNPPPLCYTSRVMSFVVESTIRTSRPLGMTACEASVGAGRGVDALGAVVLSSGATQTFHCESRPPALPLPKAFMANRHKEGAG